MTPSKSPNTATAAGKMPMTGNSAPMPHPAMASAGMKNLSHLSVEPKRTFSAPKPSAAGKMGSTGPAGC